MEKFCFQNIYSRLGDEKSMFLFKERLNYSLTGDLQKMIREIRDKQNIAYKKLQNPQKKNFLFGSGYQAHYNIDFLSEIYFQAFIDNDKSKVGKQDVLPIISFEEFIENSENAIVFISSNLHGDEMKSQLIDNGFPKDSIIEHSDIFLQINSMQYFDLLYNKPQKNEFFIDAGGYDGETTKGFFQWLQNNGNGTGRSIIFEPNSIQYDICKNNMQNYNNVKVVNKGLWYKKDSLRFQNNGGSSCVTKDGEEVIETISLDEYLKEEKEPVTFIKMDIEGAELNALKGAERIIKEHKPKLAICIYHKPEDIWEIPNLLLDFVPDYKFYIRHYSCWFHETVLYALPN